jgi:hypothetical protein
VPEPNDIVARISSAPGTNSVGALAAYLGRACGHVLLDTRVISQGYRFHPPLGEDIPAFFNRRFSTGSTNLAVTLQYGIALDGNADPLDECASHDEACAIVAALPDGHHSVWLARVTVGAAMLEVRDVAEPLFIAKHPNEFRAIAEELIGLGLLESHGCQLCLESAEAA